MNVAAVAYSADVRPLICMVTWIHIPTPLECVALICFAESTGVATRPILMINIT